MMNVFTAKELYSITAGMMSAPVILEERIIGIIMPPHIGGLVAV
jgi:hypothetical protein